jgi:diketogulonate reductase-like aldo/keto reductase
VHDLASTTTVAPGVEMPRLGLGTYKSADGEEVEGAVRTALEIGYRGVDTASFYGNERGVGSAVRTSGLAREDVFVATKVWNDEQGYEGTLEALGRSLDRLGLDHVDLYLVHWPIPELMEGTWRAMETALAEGRTRAIGVCNFMPHHLDALGAFARVRPAVDQCEFHPRLQQPALVRSCNEHGVTLQAWAPLMRGGVGRIAEITGIGDRHGRTAAQVTLRWMLQRGVATIPKSVHEARLVENADVFDFELEESEMATLDALDSGERIGPDPDVFSG